MRGSLSGELQSHPGKKLVDHLLGTAELARQIVEFHGLQDMERDTEAAALTHDLGKADPEFQRYLQKKGKGVNHSLPSSFFTLSLLQDAAEPFDVFFSAEAVRRHHSRTEDWEDVISPFWCNVPLERAQGQMKTLILGWQYALEEAFWKKFIRAIFKRCPKASVFPDYWLRLRSVLSVLVAGDRLDAVRVGTMDFQPLPDFTPYSFPDIFSGGEVSERRRITDAWRSEVAERCLRNVAELTKNWSPGLFTLTLPTGAGKTNIGLRTAHTLAKNLGYSTVVYALPFISIVEQNAAFAKSVFGSESVQEDHSLMLTRLDEEADDGAQGLYVEDGIPQRRGGDEAFVELVQEEKGKAWRRSMRLFRYWGSPVVVTTMMQLWSTLFNPKAGAAINFHRLRNAVVLMDEPQGISCKLWQGLGETLRFIHERWGTVFVLMTATQPKIFGLSAQCGRESVELAPPVRFPFNRHRYRFVEGKYLLDDLPALLRQHVPSFAERSGMLVFNTRRSARAAYELLKSFFGDAPVFMLSRWMTAEHRRKTLKEIKSLEKCGERRYLIATQVVEAGVDLDFDWVFRDLAPLDSLIQVAGRCNRSGERDEGLVLIAALHNAKGQAFAGSIYKDVSMDQTRLLLEAKPEFDERDVADIIARYYEALMRLIAPQSPWKNIVEGRWGWEEYIPLFDETDFDVPLYVDHDGNLDELLNELVSLDRGLENRERLKALNNRLQQYAVGVGGKLLEEWRDHVGHFVGGEGQEKLEQVGDAYHIVRAAGIGEGEEMIYHPVAGFTPFEKRAQEDFW